jgi:hypothetical protein
MKFILLNVAWQGARGMGQGTGRADFKDLKDFNDLKVGSGSRENEGVKERGGDQ